MGAPVRTVVVVALILHASAEVNEGHFDPAWLDQPNFTKVLAVVPRHEIMSVIESVFVSDFAGFKEQAAEAPPIPLLERYQFNPLAARPFLRLSDGRLVAPVPQMIGRKLSPIELYYRGLKRWDVAFAHDLGELFEDYVGRQLKMLPGADVHGEIHYKKRKQELKGVDWIVVFEDLVLLIEAKATRVPNAARAADVSAKDMYIARLGEAFKQLDRTYQALQDGLPEFDHIPKDRPVLGMVATLDPWYMANGMARDFLPSTAVPTTVASIRDIEHFVGVGQAKSASAVLRDIMRHDNERRTWELSVALGDFVDPAERNPLLDEAWERLPFDYLAS